MRDYLNIRILWTVIRYGFGNTYNTCTKLWCTTSPPRLCNMVDLLIVPFCKELIKIIEWNDTLSSPMQAYCESPSCLVRLRFQVLLLIFWSNIDSSSRCIWLGCPKVLWYMKYKCLKARPNDIRWECLMCAHDVCSAQMFVRYDDEAQIQNAICLLNAPWYAPIRTFQEALRLQVDLTEKSEPSSKLYVFL